MHTAGKSAYFEGGVRAASFIHSPLLPARTAGTVLAGVVSLADWYSTFAHLAGLDPTDHGHHPSPSLPKPYGTGDFPIDSVNLWPWLSGANGTAPRQQLIIGKADGEAMIAPEGWKIVVGVQAPDWWYGAYAPNCTDGNGGHPDNCAQGCLFNIESDPGEHVNLKASQPQRYAALKAELDAAVGTTPHPRHSAVDVDPHGRYDQVQLPHDDAACTAMETSWRGFFGPYDGARPSPGPHPPRKCTWKNDTDYDVGGGGVLGPPQDSMSKQECCSRCWANPGCAAAVFSGAKANGRCATPPGSRCCWLKTKAELAKPGNDPGTVSCIPERWPISSHSSIGPVRA